MPSVSYPPKPTSVFFPLFFLFPAAKSVEYYSCFVASSRGETRLSSIRLGSKLPFLALPAAFLGILGGSYGPPGYSPLVFEKVVADWAMLSLPVSVIFLLYASAMNSTLW